MDKYKVWLMLTLCNLFWAGNYVFGSYVVDEMSPIWISFVRWTGAAIILIGVAYFYEKPDFKKALKSWPILLLLSILGIVGYNTVVYLALVYTSSMNAVLVNSLNPALIVIASIFLLKESISRYQGMGIIISLLGVLVILTNGNLSEVLTMDYNKGDLLMLVAISVWTLYSIWGKRIPHIPPITATAITAVMASIIMAPVALAQGNQISGISNMAIVGLVYVSIFPSVLSFIFWNLSIRKIGASKSGVFLNLMPVFTALINWILGEKITDFQIYGGLFVLLGVLLTTGVLDAKLKKGLLLKGEDN